MASEASENHSSLANLFWLIGAIFVSALVANMVAPMAPAGQLVKNAVGIIAFVSVFLVIMLLYNSTTS